MAESKRGPGRPPGSKNKTTKNNTGAASSKAKAKAQEIQAKKKADQRVMDEIWAIITIAIGAFLAVATMTGGAGEFGNMIGAALRGVFGFMAYILPFYLILFGVLLKITSKKIVAVIRMINTVAMHFSRLLSRNFSVFFMVSTTSS